MNWGSFTASLVAAILLSVPASADCTLFTRLFEIDKRARSLLTSAEDEERHHRLSLLSAADSAEGLLDKPELEGLAEFLAVRRELALAEPLPRTGSARDEVSARMHQTRRALVEYGEAWSCFSNSERADAAADRGGTAWASHQGDDGAAKDGRPRFNWAWVLVFGLLLPPIGWILWESRRSRLRERHDCRVACLLGSEAAMARADVVDISRMGAKISVSGFPVSKGETINVIIQDRLIRMTVAWTCESFIGGKFKKPIPRRMVNDLSSGKKPRLGAAARRGASSARQNTAPAPATETVREARTDPDLAVAAQIRGSGA